MNTPEKPLFQYHTPMKDKILPSILSALVLSSCVKFLGSRYLLPIDNQLIVLALYAILMVFFYLMTFKVLARMDQTLIITKSNFFASTYISQINIPFKEIAQFSITKHPDLRPQYSRGLIEIRLKNGQDYFTAIFLSQAQIDVIAYIVNVQLKVSCISSHAENSFEA